MTEIEWIRAEGARQLRGARYVQTKHDNALCHDLGIETKTQADTRRMKEAFRRFGEQFRQAFASPLAQSSFTLSPSPSRKTHEGIDL